MASSKSSKDESPKLAAILAALHRDYSKLAPRIRSLEHSITCECENVTLRLHFPSLRQGKATVYELVDTVLHFLIPFALPRSEIAAVNNLYGKISVDEFTLKTSQLFQSAISLFIRANKATNRNGEAGELLLYLLTEWILSAPQLIAKMSLKTSSDMPVHGADGVHVRYSSERSKLILYWGESKFYEDVAQAIVAAVKSISNALDPKKMQHELELVQRNIDFSGLDAVAQSELLRHLDPFDEASNERHDVITCLIGFDFEAFKQITASDGDTAEEKFCELAKTKLAALSKTASNTLKAAGLAGQTIEIFFFPVPSVQDFRDLFQAKIGWK